MSRSAFVLQEMGLSPLWRPRGEPDVLNSPEPQAAAVAEIATLTMVATPPRAAAVASTAPAAKPATIEVNDVAPQAKQPDTLPIQDWDSLHAQVAACQHCELAKTRHNVVVGRGNTKARLLIIGEAPGEQEDRQGLPFVGKAGQLLENMLAAAGIHSTEDVYICNVVKCRPPGNRNPAPAEIASCASYLQWQINTIQPDLIVALGRFAAHTLLNSQAPISALRKQLHHAHGRPLLVTFHPAYLLRSPGEKAKAWQDWHQVKCQLAG